MSRERQIPAAMMAAFAGLQGSGGVATAFSVARVMYTLQPWTPLTSAEIERALQVAVRYKLSPDLAEFLPPAPGRFAGRKRKDAYTSVIIALKRVDELSADDRAEAIGQVRELLGARQT